MFPYLLAAFIGIPLIEIALFIEVGGAIGTAATILVVIATAVLGAWMLRAQGVSTARRAQMRLQNGEIPLDQAFDGMFLVFAGALLLTPGFLTDAIGFSLFVPQVRAWLRGRLTRWAQRTGSFTVVRTGFEAPPGPGHRPASGPHRTPESGPERGAPTPGDTIDIEADADGPADPTSPWHGEDGRGGAGRG